jgi:hypothetical protein
MAAFQQGLQDAEAARDNHPSIRAEGNVAWQFVLIGDPKMAEWVATNAFARAPDQIWLETSEADALMILGQTAAARKIYLQYEDVQDDGLGHAWKTDVLNDFVTLTTLGDDYPLMQEIRNDFAHETSGARQASGS